MRSRLVVISWWSNCLGLACLHQLAGMAGGREVYVVQVGKGEAQKALFRQHLPPGVIDLPYPEDAPAEHCRVLQFVMQQVFPFADGLWLIDHDFLLHADWQPWFQAADEQFAQTDYCLCLPCSEHPNQGITSPAFWLSPSRWPPETSPLDPIPYQPRPEARRPDLFRSALELHLPVKDTLLQARDELLGQGKVGYYWFGDGQGQPLSPGPPLLTLPPTPASIHLGGLYLFSGEIPVSLFQEVPSFRTWAENTVQRFTGFFEQRCPAEWLAIEDPELLRRVKEFALYLYG